MNSLHSKKPLSITSVRLFSSGLGDALSLDLVWHTINYKPGPVVRWPEKLTVKQQRYDTTDPTRDLTDTENTTEWRLPTRNFLPVDVWIIKFNYPMNGWGCRQDSNERSQRLNTLAACHVRRYPREKFNWSLYSYFLQVNELIKD